MKQKVIAVVGVLVIAAASFAFAMRDNSPKEADCVPVEDCSMEATSCCSSGK